MDSSSDREELVMSTPRGHFEGLFDKLPVRPDRRAHPRAYAHKLAYVQLGDENGGIALNISEGGLAITTAEILTSDYFPRITFQLPRSDIWMEARGEVAWTSHSKKEAGIQFVDLADSDRERIRRWIANNDSSQGQMRGTSEDTRERDMESLGIRATSKHLVKDRKLEVLSEADEAKFASMFPSEKSLTNIHEDEAETQDAEPWVAEKNPRNVLRFSEPILKRGEHAGVSKGNECFTDKPIEATTPALSNGSHSVDEDTCRIPEISEDNSLLVSRINASCADEHLPMNDGEQAQPENAKAEPTYNNPAESEPPEPAAIPKENPAIATEAEESSKIGTGGADGKEQEAHAYVLTREADLIQQLELHRRNRAANLLLGQEREVPIERRSGWLLAALILLIGIMCFAVGIGVGNGFFDKLLGRDQELEQRSDAKPANLPAAAAGENDFAGGSAVAGNAQKSLEASPGNSAVAVPNNMPERATSDAATGTEANAPAQTAPTRAANTKSGDGGNLAAKDTDSSNDSSSNSNSPANSLSSDAPAGDATNDLRATPGTTANSPAESETARPFSEIKAPILVTAPDERSGPFRLALTEQAVSASRTLAISAQRFVSVPAQPGPTSSHQPERLQAGVLIFHVDPLLTANQRELAGTVKVRATIGKSGDVIDVQPISGPALLIPAVVRAVREWRYTVTLLDGQPMGAEEDVVVEFRPRN